MILTKEQKKVIRAFERRNIRVSEPRCLSALHEVHPLGGPVIIDVYNGMLEISWQIEPDGYKQPVSTTGNF